jgi:ADP-heptose:LPS heptosyltransferase
LNTSFIISGGAGRVISAIPSLEKFHKLNPEDNFKVFVCGWESVYWSHPLLQNRTFSIGQKGIFEQYIKDSKLVVPEPYQRRSYYTQQKSIAEVFDEEINNTDDHSDLQKANLYIQTQELISAKSIIENKKAELKRNKVIVFQPYGSGMKIVGSKPYDSTIRSLDVDDYLKIAKNLSEDYLVVYFGEKEFIHPGDNFSWKPCVEIQTDIRFWMTCIYFCDYFLGVDSLGQHIARSFEKEATIIMGSTFEKNVSYPEHFNFFRNEHTPVYSPIRIDGIDCEFADRSNNNCMAFSNEQLNNLCETVREQIKQKVLNKVWRW